MNKRRLTIVSVIIGVTLLSMTLIESISKKEIIKSYPDFIHAKISTYNDSLQYIHMRFDSIKGKHFLASVVNENLMVLDYLLINHSKVFIDKEIEFLMSDSVKLRTYFYNSLAKDSTFNLHFMQLAYNCLKKENKTISDYKSLNKVEISVDSLINIATQFYYVYKLDKDGFPRFKVCIGTNGCSKNDSIEMLPLIEAFCFDVVLHEYDYVYNDYSAAMKKVSEMKVGNISLVEKKIYYRNAMYAEMKKSKHLRKILIEKYKEKESVLNFTILED